MSVLERIVADKRADVAQRKKARPRPHGAEGLAPSDRSLEAALRKPRTGFILECKQASPSQGTLRPHYEPVAIARAYAPYADAISVLCDAPYFGGSLEHLRAVRAEVALPVLCKDFVVDPYQVYEARQHGADAILLMASVLRPEELVSCLAVATSLSMDALVEVHDEAELRWVLETEARIVGINNRNLATLDVDLDTTRRLAPMIDGDRVVVCESGIRGHGDVVGLRGQCHGFLVGTAMMRRDDLSLAVRELIYGRAKICGLTRAEDAAAVVDAGGTHGGLILWPGSKRGTDVASALDIVAEDLQWVGVFVDETPERILSAVERLRLSAVQLHGDETPEDTMRLKAQLPQHVELWRARRVGRDAIGTAADHGADRLLLDAYVPGERGGTGHRFDWNLIGEHPERAELILSGGITPKRAAAADALGCWAIDAASGIETAPGHKDHDAVVRFFGALRGEKTRV